MHNELENAKKQFRDALAGKIKEKAWGPEHLYTLETVEQLGIVDSSQDDHDEAVRMCKRAAEGKQKHFGDPVHRDVLDSLHNLGTCYEVAGNAEMAVETYMRVIKGKEKAWGPEHYSTLETVSTLALFYERQKNKEEARTQYQRALNGFVKILSTEYELIPKTGDRLKEDEMVKVQEIFRRALENYLHWMR